MRRFGDSDRGAALVEMAAVFGLLMLIAIGGFEWGMAFRDSISVSTSAREAARVASSAGRDTNADCFIIEAAAGALQAISGNKVVELWIYESDTSGTVGRSSRYRPGQPSDVSLVCNGAWFRISNNYPPSSRDNDGSTRAWIGVQITYDHAWKTGFAFWRGTSRWSERAVMHLEPAVPNF
ncbi:MAG TPA: TadE/TadG family type IV pilus assembly protein [Acidimicrobiia bacterium]|jgi:hypothetical protein